MSYVIIHRKDGVETIIRRRADGGTEVLQKPSPNDLIRRGMVSRSNGIVGGKKVMRAHEEADAKLGVSDCVRYVPIGHGAYEAHHPSVAAYEKWMRAKRRVNHHAGDGTPCPGDFGYQ